MSSISIAASNRFLAAINSLHRANTNGVDGTQPSKTKAELLEEVDATYRRDKQYKAKLTQLKREMDATEVERQANRDVIDRLRKEVDASYPSVDDAKETTSVFGGESKMQIQALSEISIIIRNRDFSPFVITMRLIDYFVWYSSPASNALVGDIKRGNIMFIAHLINTLHQNIDARNRRFLFDIAYGVYYQVTSRVNKRPPPKGYTGKFIPHINQLSNVEDPAIADVSHSVFVGAFLSGDYDRAGS